MNEEAIAIESPAGRLEGRLCLIEGAATAMVFCHPHPLFGGDMDNAVVQAVVRERSAAGWSTLRFNFRGTGGSEGSFGGGAGEAEDVASALVALGERACGAAIVLGGYSFGAALALAVGSRRADVSAIVAVAAPFGAFPVEVAHRPEIPIALLVGSADEYCPLATFEERVADLGPRARTAVVSGADHFFAGREGELARAVAGLLDED